MPPSRAQIKQHLVRKGVPLRSINVNMDNHSVIEYFLKSVGMEEKKIALFVADILEARKHSTAGFSRLTLQNLLIKHGITDKVQISGHGHLIRVPSSQLVDRLRGG